MWAAHLRTLKIHFFLVLLFAQKLVPNISFGIFPSFCSNKQSVYCMLLNMHSIMMHFTFTTITIGYREEPYEVDAIKGWRSRCESYGLYGHENAFNVMFCTLYINDVAVDKRHFKGDLARNCLRVFSVTNLDLYSSWV